tara:strand:- start:12327 stop:13052 length:726 start_codon:yes stop_codon:yes gene_type:complete
MNEEAEAVESEVVTEGGDPRLETTEQARPEGLPEKFNTIEDLVKSYTSLEGKLGKKDEDLRNAIIEELSNEAFANRPETAGDYQLPESIDEETAVDNQLLQWWSNTAFENGYSQDQFEEGINMYIEALNADVPDYDQEVQRLGENAEARQEAASLFANQFFEEKHLPAIERMCETADGIEALEFMMQSMKDGGPAIDSQPVAQITQDQLNQMMLDPRWHDPAKRDMSFVKEVEDGFKRLYG